MRGASAMIAALLLRASAVSGLALSPQPSDNLAPTFTDGRSTTRLVAENSAGGVHIQPPVRAIDVDGHRLTYSLGGVDADSFALDSRGGQLRTLDGVDYNHEAKDRYAVTVRAEDGRGGTARIAVTIEVADKLEPPSAPDSPTVVGSTRNTVTVRWMAPANIGPEIRDYSGQYRVAGSNATFDLGWERVGVITQATISGLAEDTLYEVQVQARNAEGASSWSESTQVRTEKNRPPVFDEGPSTTRRLEENTAAGVNVGAPVTAMDADNDRLVYSLERLEESAFRIDSSSGQLITRAGATYDYEAEPEHSVTVKAEDGSGGSATCLVTVSLTDVDDTPVADAGWDLTVAVGETAWLDGRASRKFGEDELTYSWALVSWPVDSQPTLVDPSTATPSFVAAAEGTYLARLTVSGGGLTDSDDVVVVARPSTEAAQLVTADLLVDTNRDGAIDPSDEEGEDTWSTATGAVFGPNADDDDGDGVRDGWDDRANGDADLLDMAPVVVRRIPGLHRKHSVVLEMAFTSELFSPRLFYEQTGGAPALLMGGDDVQAELPLEQLVAGDLRVYIDSSLGRYIGFDGHLALALKVRSDGTTISEDRVALRGGPVLFSHHLQPVERVFVVDSWSNTALMNSLSTHLPASVDLYRLSESTYSEDIWIQDSMQTAYAQRPSVGGVETVAVHTQLHRGRGLWTFLPREYLSPRAGYVYPGGEYYSSFNYGGNVEVIPPHTHNGKEYPYGRVVIGGDPGYAGMVQQQVDFFNSQGVQGPVIVVDTAWLNVGHVDEVISILPNRSSGSDESPWIVLIGSPKLAIELLEAAVEDGAGDVPVFEGRGWDETTPRRLLADSSLMDTNDYAQRKIDTVESKLVAELGLTNSDFRRVPALFYEEYDGLAALMPNIQNLLVVDDTLFVPDPEGPIVDGADVWRQAALDIVDGLGLTAHFVDVYYSYHVLWGAVHCGTNTESAGSKVPWWLNAGTEGSQ